MVRIIAWRQLGLLDPRLRTPDFFSFGVGIDNSFGWDIEEADRFDLSLLCPPLFDITSHITFEIFSFFFFFILRKSALFHVYLKALFSLFTGWNPSDDERAYFFLWIGTEQILNLMWAFQNFSSILITFHPSPLSPFTFLLLTFHIGQSFYFDLIIPFRLYFLFFFFTSLQRNQAENLKIGFSSLRIMTFWYSYKSKKLSSMSKGLKPFDKRLLHWL